MANIRASAEAVLGFERPPKRNKWFDKECQAAYSAKNDAYKRTLQSDVTRAIVENYRQRRREQIRLLRRKNRELKRRDREEMKMFRSRNDFQHFFRKVKCLRESFNPAGMKAVIW